MVGAVDLDQLAIAFAAQARLVESPAPLARQPNAILDHPLERDLKPIVFRQHLSRQHWTEIRGILFDQAQDIVLFGIVDAIVWRFAARLMPDHESAALAVSLQKSEYLPPCQIQQDHRNHYPSYVRSSSLPYARRVTLRLCGGISRVVATASTILVSSALP